MKEKILEYYYKKSSLFSEKLYTVIYQNEYDLINIFRKKLLVTDEKFDISIINFIEENLIIFNLNDEKNYKLEFLESYDFLNYQNMINDENNLFIIESNSLKSNEKLMLTKCFLLVENFLLDKRYFWNMMGSFERNFKNKGKLIIFEQ